jgi:hypothetical protein
MSKYLRALLRGGISLKSWGVSMYTLTCAGECPRDEGKGAAQERKGDLPPSCLGWHLLRLQHQKRQVHGSRLSKAQMKAEWAKPE